jgi:hypothetical protein
MRLRIIRALQISSGCGRHLPLSDVVAIAIPSLICEPIILPCVTHQGNGEDVEQHSNSAPRRRLPFGEHTPTLEHIYA